MKNNCCSNIKGIIPFLKTISDENRLRIICFLKSGEKCVCEIVDFLDLPQNLVSHHLKKLRDENILLSRKVGLNVKYSINKDKTNNYIDNLNSLF